jgi:uncharacterized protein (DUF433 family)
MNARTDPRFTDPLYTVAEASRFLGVPASTLGTWSKGYVRQPSGRSTVRGDPIITSIAKDPGEPTIPFGGLAEAMVLADPWAVRVISPATARPIVVADPSRAFGQPIFATGAAPVESAESRIKAGERPDEVAADFGVPLEDVAEYLHILLPVAA